MLDKFPLGDELDQLILMHRNVHFSGSWEEMLRYYREEGLGCQEEISVERLQILSDIEKQRGIDLFQELCSPDQQEQVQRAIAAYARWRELYRLKDPDARRAQLVADLVLAEEPEIKAIRERIIAEGVAVVPLLLEILRQPQMLDPLFPGYGLAPGRACEALACIGDQRAIIPIFEVLLMAAQQLQRPFDTEQAAIEALAHLGEPAKQFLLQVIGRHPIGHDHLHAAMALCNFSLKPEELQLIRDVRTRDGVGNTLDQYLAILLGEG